MVDYTKETKAQLVEHAKTLGVTIPAGATKRDVYQAILAKLRDQRDLAVAQSVIDDETEAEEQPYALVAVPSPATAPSPWPEREQLVERAESLPEVSRWTQMEAMARVLCRSSLMPKHIRDSADPEANCMVILLTAHDLGLTSTLALRKIAVIEGQPALGADLMRLLVQRDGHDIRIELTRRDGDDYPTAATVAIHRTEWEPGDWRPSTYTLADAVDAGLCTLDDHGRARARSSGGAKKPWERYTEDMLVARATSRACRRYCADSLGGISYAPDELGTIDVDETDLPASAGPAPDLTEAQPSEVRRLIDRIDTLTDIHAKAWLREQWKTEGLNPLRPLAGTRGILHSEVPAADRLIDEAELRSVADAEVVAEGTDVPPCDTDPDEAPKSVSASDPVDLEVARAYAREQIEKAREQIGATLCDVCKLPIAERNDDCPSQLHIF